MVLHCHEIIISDLQTIVFKNVQHLNRSKCIEIARKNVSLVPINVMNSFSAVSEDDSNAASGTGEVFCQDFGFSELAFDANSMGTSSGFGSTTVSNVGWV